MSRPVLIAQSHVKADEIDFSILDPAFRRATTNMTLATLACQNVLEQLPLIAKEDVSILLGTHFGELSASLDFLKTYHETQVPRPILFQNSLHNSTLGFATIQLGLTGPALTVSTDQKTRQSVFDLAENMLLITPYVLLCFVDSVPDLVAPHYVNYMPELPHFLNQAYCFLYTTPDIQKRHELPTAKQNWEFFPCFT